MNELQLNDSIDDTIRNLMSHFGYKTKEQLIKKALNTLKMINYVAKNNGELIARKGLIETKLII
jgi:aspartate ammonia-lyase